MSEASSRKDRSKTIPQVWVILLVAVAFLMSILTLQSYILYGWLDTTASSALSDIGFQLDIGTLLVVMTLTMLALSTMKPQAMRLMLWSGTVMLIPAVLSFSNIDWAYYLSGGKYSLILLENHLPEIFLFCNGIALLSAGIMVRSYEHIQLLRADLRERGASEQEIDHALKKNYDLILMLVGASVGVSAAICGTVCVIIPLLSPVIATGESAYALFGMIAGLSMTVLFGVYIWYGTRDKNTGKKPSHN